MITTKRLCELLDYNPLSGAFTRLIRTCNRVKVGEQAGALNKLGYRQINIDGTIYYEHRLAWLWVTGKWPTNDIDHLDGDRTNNAFSNLRDVPRGMNLENQRKASKNSKTGFLGVIAYKDRFRATIVKNHKHYFLGTFDTAEKAHQAYVQAKRVIHGGGTL